MTRAKLEKYLGLKVKITLFDDDILVGILHKTGEKQFKNDPNLYIPKNHYFLLPQNSCIFKCSHIKKIDLI